MVTIVMNSYFQRSQFCSLGLDIYCNSPNEIPGTSVKVCFTVIVFLL